MCCYHTHRNTLLSKVHTCHRLRISWRLYHNEIELHTLLLWLIGHTHGCSQLATHAPPYITVWYLCTTVKGCSYSLFIVQCTNGVARFLPIRLGTLLAWLDWHKMAQERSVVAQCCAATRLFGNKCHEKRQLGPRFAVQQSR